MSETVEAKCYERIPFSGRRAKANGHQTVPQSHSLALYGNAVLDFLYKVFR